MSVLLGDRRRGPGISRFGVFLCLLFPFAGAMAVELPPDAPILISEAGSTRALAMTGTGRRADYQRVFRPGLGTRITVFVTNLQDLLPNEDALAFRSDVEDARHFRYPIDVLSVEPIEERKWVYKVVIRLNPDLGDVGDVLLRLTWRGLSSNRVRLSIDHEGGKVEDDEGAVPTPMPDKPIVGESLAPQASLPYIGDRVRFMQQATFGVNASTESLIRRIGYSTWIEQQAEERRDVNGDVRYSTFPYPNVVPMPIVVEQACPDVATRTSCTRNNFSMYPLQNWFFREALYGDDQQLRRRVSWAFSQIFVVGGRETVQSGRMLEYIKVLDRNAFGNYRNLLKEMTLSPAMGNYLDMAVSTSQNPNENYAREILQLFSVGVDRLLSDGRPMLDISGNHIPTYDQNTINNFAKVFTGWSFCNTSDCPNARPGVVNYTDPLRASVANHDTSQKVLFGGRILPAGLSPQDDLDQALDNIFYHPNVGPFVCKNLIQLMVTSNPTPAYVGRVAAVFNDNGRGVRGDMKAVVRAILLDPEARGNIKTDPNYGHLREPVLFVTNILRPYNAQSNVNAAVACNGLSDGILNVATLPLDQDVFQPPTVFNYYPMDYIIPNTGFAGPEFGIFSTGTALKRPSLANQMAPPNNNPTTPGVTVVNTPEGATYIPCGTRIDLARLQALSQQDSTGALLVDTLGRELLNGGMSSAMRSDILTAVQAVTAADNGLKRARTAYYLVTTSPQFQVQR